MHLREEKSRRVHMKGVLVACLGLSLSTGRPTAPADKVPLVGYVCVRPSVPHWLLGEALQLPADVSFCKPRSAKECIPPLSLVNAWQLSAFQEDR